jgi:2-isopropylmalate synthase
VTIVGKAWDLHVNYVLKTTLEENLRMIEESISYLKEKGKTVFFDAEHLFDGYKKNKEYALKVLKTAEKSGADTICLCDTNGGTLLWELEEIIKEIIKEIKTPLGIHIHNDSGLAVANTLLAVKLGITQVQGTINGYGERCGNADLTTIIPALKLKMGINCISDFALEKLTKTSHYISEIANLIPRNDAPYVGNSAFAHKGGMHVSAILAFPETSEHIKPELVGNNRRILVSELSGKSNIIYKAQEYNIDLTTDTPEVRKILEELKKREKQGYQYEGAEASFELLIKKFMGTYKKLFEFKGFRLIIEKQGENPPVAEATIKLLINDTEKHVVAEGDGPVNALDNALRKALKEFYPEIENMKLTDFKVRVINGEAGTAAKVRVFVETSDQKDSWSTVGVSENIIEASWEALVDSIEYGLTHI